MLTKCALLSLTLDTVPRTNITAILSSSDQPPYHLSPTLHNNNNLNHTNNPAVLSNLEEKRVFVTSSVLRSLGGGAVGGVGESSKASTDITAVATTSASVIGIRRAAAGICDRAVEGQLEACTALLHKTEDTVAIRRSLSIIAEVGRRTEPMHVVADHQ